MRGITWPELAWARGCLTDDDTLRVASRNALTAAQIRAAFDVPDAMEVDVRRTPFTDLLRAIYANAPVLVVVRSVDDAPVARIGPPWTFALWSVSSVPDVDFLTRLRRRTTPVQRAALSEVLALGGPVACRAAYDAMCGTLLATSDAHR